MIERKRAEESLQASEESFRHMVEGVKDYAIFMVDLDGRVITWNSGAEHMKGYSRQEILGRQFSLFYEPCDVESGKPEHGLKEAAATGRFEDEGWLVRKDGSRFWANVIITALKDEAGKLQSFVKVTRDMSERKRAEETLRRSEAYLAEAQRLSHTASWAWNVSSGELFWSLEHFRILGLDPKRVKPSYPMALQCIHPEDRSFVQQTFERAIRERSNFEQEYRIVLPDGILKHVHSYGHPVFNEPGDLTEYVGTIIDTTERREIEQTLQENQQRLRVALESSAVAFTILRAVRDESARIIDFEWLYLNPAASLIIGRAPDEAIGRRVLEVLPGGWDPPGLFACFVQVVDTGEPGDIEVASAHYGIQGWFHNIAAKLGDGIAVWFTDVTERKQAEARLQRSEALLADGQRISHTGTWVVKLPSEDVFWSQEMFRIYGLDPATTKLSQQMAFQLIHPEDRSFVKEAFERALRDKSDFAIEHRAILADGSIKHLYALGHPVLNESGDLLEYVGTVVDITERKQAEEALRRSEAYLAEGQKLSHTSSWGWNISTGDLFWSLEHFRIFGLDPRNFKPTKETTQHLIHPEDRALVEQTLARAVREKSDFELDFRIILSDGSTKAIHSLGHPILKESGELEFIGTAMDVTERKRAEQALDTAQAELAHVTRVMALGELVASIAHEVNQPLGAIVTNGQACLRLLARESPDLHKSREVVERMISDGMRASEVITRNRALLKKNDAEKALLNVNEVIQGVIALTSTELSKSEIHLQTALAADLPRVLGDRVQLQQVILNLILNAKEAMSGVGWKPRDLFITSLASKAGEAVVVVRDSGTGFDPRDCDRIFDAFFTTKAEGLGLGLSISRTIIEAHGGRLWATLNEDEGATIQFTLPSSRRRG